jgi:hypothetical protein
MWMLALTAWLPSGLDHSVRLAGPATARVLSLAAAAGLALGALVLVRAHELPIVVRAGVVAFAPYGVLACLQGAWAGAPLPDVLAAQAPSVLQAASLGGLLLLPMAVVIAVVKIGVRRPAPGSFARAWFEAAALATVLATVVAALPQREVVARGPSAQPVPAGHVLAGPAPGESAAAGGLQEVLRVLEEAERDAPRDRWDPDYVVREAGRDPQVLTDWVRDSTYWIPYRGLLRGAIGTLMDRQGNSLDRAVLLATLLEKAGHTVRLAHDEIARPRAEQILAALEAPPDATGGEETAPEPDIAMVAVEHRLDGTAIEPTLRAQAEAMKPVLATLDARVGDQTARLLSAVARPKPDRDRRREAALSALQDHWWVQIQEGERWRDLDVLIAAGPGLATAAETLRLQDIGATLRHAVAVRVVAEWWSAGVLTERPLLEHVLRPADLIGQPIALQFWPSAWPDGTSPLGGTPADAFRVAALDQSEWGVALSVGGRAIAQATLRDGDEAAQALAPNPFGGLGGAIAREAQPSSSARSQELSAVWVDFEIRTPGETPHTIRRAVFDLVGAAARTVTPAPRVALDESQRLTRSLTLMMQTEIVALPCHVPPEFVRHLATQSLLGNRELLRSALAGESSPAPDTEQLLERAVPAVSPLYWLALARLEWGRLGDQVYIDRPAILTRHRFPAWGGQDLALRDATDIVAGDVGVDLDVADAFAVRLEQGVVDANLEALLHTGSPVLGNTAEAFAASRNWVTLTPDRRAGLESLTLPESARLRILQDLDSGHVVVAPRVSQDATDGRAVAWWRIDATTGDTLGVAANGWGQAMAERGVQTNLVVEAATTFAFEYAFCQAVPLAVNQTVALLHAQDGAWWLPMLPQAQDPTAIYRQNKRQCLIGAMVSTGITATLPLVLMMLRAKQLARLARRGCFAAGTLVLTAAGPIAIENVKVGTLVLARDAETGHQAYKPVVRTFVTLAKPILIITARSASGEETALSATGEHPFWVLDRGWVEAQNLQPGDLLSTSDADTLEVLASKAGPRTTVHNFEVQGFHTYFAGADPVWVHNRCGETARYGDANSKLNRWDRMDGHELLQNAWLAEHKIVAVRGLGPASRDNAIIAIPRKFHNEVNAAQRAAGLYDRQTLARQSALQNINENYKILRDVNRKLGSPLTQTDMRSVYRAAVQHGKNIGVIP